MIVYLFNDNFLTKLNLPIIVSGMYPIYNADKLVATIMSEDNKWRIRLAEGYVSNDISKEGEDIVTYKVLKIMSDYKNEYFHFIVVPKYDPNVKVFNVYNSIAIGDNVGCDIYYSYNKSVQNGQEILRIIPSENESDFHIEVSLNYLI